MVTQAGIYQMPLSEYVADPAPQPSLNAGAALTLLTQSPKHAWTAHPRLNPDYEHEESSRLDLGTIAHALLLEGACGVCVVEADDWRTKDAKAKREEARAVGQLPILSKDYDMVCAMVLSAECAIAESEIATDWAQAVPEQTLIWEEEGVWYRSRPDKATTDWRVLFDYKTTVGTAAPQLFGRGPLIRHGYDLQAALGLSGAQRLGQLDRPPTFVFVVQEMAPPYAVSFLSLSPQFLAIAHERVKLATAIWKDCQTRQQWPSYPSRIAYVDPPSYYGMDSMELGGDAL